MQPDKLRTNAAHSEASRDLAHAMAEGLMEAHRPLMNAIGMLTVKVDALIAEMGHRTGVKERDAVSQGVKAFEKRRSPQGNTKRHQKR